MSREGSACAPSPPSRAERAGVRWGIPERSPTPHLTLPSLTRWAPPSPPEGWRGILLRNARSARAEGREGDDVADRRAVGQQHDEPVDAKAKPAAGRQPIFERRDVILVERLRLLIARGARQHLRLEAGALVERVVQFGEGVGDLPAIDVGLEALDKPRVVAVGLGERRDIAGEAGHMDRLDQLVLDPRGKSGFQRMAPALVTLQGAAELLRGIARRGGVLDREEIDAGMLAHEFGHAAPRPGRGQLDLRPAI